MSRIITYENKEVVRVRPLARKFKVTAGDLNEIKSAHNEVNTALIVTELVSIARIATVAALRTTTGTAQGQTVELVGYSAINDGGGGLFFWSAASEIADNGGTVIQATGVDVGRWIRKNVTEINPFWFGAKKTVYDNEGDLIPDATSGPAVKKAIEQAMADGLPLAWESGEIDCTSIGSFNIDKPLTIVGSGKENTIFKNGNGRFTVTATIEVRNVSFRTWIKGGGNNTALFIAGAASPDKYSVYFHNVGFYDLDSAFNSNNFATEAFTSVQFSDCDFYKLQRVGIGCKRKSDSIRITGCSFIDIKNFGGVASGLVIGANAFNQNHVVITDNVFINIWGATGADNHAIIAYCDKAVITNNVISGIWATADGITPLNADETEALYTKAVHLTVSNNVVFNSATAGDGCITLKGAEDAYVSTVADNVVWQEWYEGHPISAANLRISAKSMRVTGTATVTGNVLWGTVRLTVSEGDTRNPNELNTLSFSDNQVHYGVVSLGMDKTIENLKVNDNLIISQETNTAKCLSQSGQDCRNLQIIGNTLYTQGEIVSGVGVSGNVQFDNNTCFISDVNEPFTFTSTAIETFSFRNNIIRLNPNLLGLDQSGNTTRSRFVANRELRIEGNYFEIPNNNWRPEIRFRGKGIIRGNTFEWLGDTRATFSFFFGSGNPLFRNYDQLEFLSNKFLNIQNGADSQNQLIDFPADSRVAVLRFNDNYVDTISNLIKVASNVRISYFEAIGNNFPIKLTRMNASTTAFSKFTEYTEAVIRENRGWKTEQDGAVSTYTSGTDVTHGIDFTPTNVQATPLTDAGTFRVTDRNDTRFRIAFSEAGTQSFAWRASVFAAPPTAVGTITLASPADEATGQTLTPTLTWNHADGAVKYNLQIADNVSIPDNLIYDSMNVYGTVSGGVVSFIVPAGLLTAATTYYWRVSPISNTRYAFSTQRSFTTA